MITYKRKDIVLIARGAAQVMAVYRGTKLVWERIASCFSSGFWRENLPFKESTTWKE